MSGPWDLPAPPPPGGRAVLGRAVVEGVLAGGVLGVAVAMLLAVLLWLDTASPPVDPLTAVGGAYSVFSFLPYAVVLGGVVGGPLGLGGGLLAALVLWLGWCARDRDWARVRAAVPVGVVLALALAAVLVSLEVHPGVAAGLALVAGLIAAWRAERAVRRLVRRP